MTEAIHGKKDRPQDPDADYPSLYDLTGNITDINKVIVQRLALRAILNDSDLLRKHAAKEIADSTLLTGLSVTNGGINMGMEGGAAALLVEALAGQFKAEGGVNYVELSFTSNQAVPGERFVVTLQRVNGLTPTQKLAAAEAELKTLKPAV